MENATTRKSLAEDPLDDADRFCAVLSQVAGKRLTYAEVTGKVSPTCS